MEEELCKAYEALRKQARKVCLELHISSERVPYGLIREIHELGKLHDAVLDAKYGSEPEEITSGSN